ncbi:MAG: TnsA endonuclease N-terminal domain-containing protein [Synergistaceae bacterium]|nr:TnsA endonuclease N-terminal domain-containing protein [Synergistaceae bacterium]
MRIAIASDKVKEIYFTGMFTSDQGDLSVYYYDPESGRLRKYYPDFCARMDDGSYRLIEVKREDMIDSSVIKAKTDATREIAGASGIKYRLYTEQDITSGNIFA